MTGREHGRRGGAILVALLAAACTGAATRIGGGDGVSVSPPAVRLGVGDQAQFTAAVNGVTATQVGWSVSQGAAGGTITPTGRYTAPGSAGTFDVVATVTTSGAPVTGSATVNVSSCWELQTVTRARIFPRAGASAAMVGGSIQGSNDSATNGFVVLATLGAQPAEGQWTELAFASTTPYRWVKYFGPIGGYGQIAELELWSGAVKVTGGGFGTAGSRSGNPWQNALDGDTATFFDANTANDAYVGLDLANGHAVAAPSITPAGGSFTTPQSVTLATATGGATIRYTLDGSDPLTSASARTYAAPFTLSSTATVRAAATAACSYPSPGVTALFTISGSSGGAKVSLHMGNSLTDTVDGYLPLVAAAGGQSLSFDRYTIPGIGTWLYDEDPTGGNWTVHPAGTNVQTYVRGTALDHVSMQPYPNMPCAPYGNAGASPARNRSDAVNLEQVWTDAVAHNPNVQMWIYGAWQGSPADSSNWASCLTAPQDYQGAWVNTWVEPAPTTWNQSQLNQGKYMELVRTAMMNDYPARPPPYIIPAPRAMMALRASVEGGTFPGVAANAFSSTFYLNGGVGDDHLQPIGRYYISLLFYACMFQADPRALPDTNMGTPATVTAAQAVKLQDLAYQAASGYALSGYAR